MITTRFDPISGLYERYLNGQFVGLFASEQDAAGDKKPALIRVEEEVEPVN